MEQKLDAGNVKKLFLTLGALGLAGTVYTFLQNKTHFAFSYLTAFTFGMSILLGALCFVMIQHITLAGWSVTCRRLAEKTVGTFSWYWILLLPLVFLCFKDLFPWASPETVAKDPILSAKVGYLNTPFFLIRTALFFAGWYLLSRALLKKSLQQDQDGKKEHSARLRKWSAGGLIFYGVSETFFALDWTMSLQPHWFSTIYGLIFFSSSAVAFYSFLILLALILRKKGLLVNEINVEHYHDLGKLLFGFNLFWAYVAFSQWMLIWYANLGEETTYYHMRQVGAWKEVSIGLILIHFVFPLFYLLSRHVKRNLLLLGFGAFWMFVASYYEMYWMIMPNFYKEGAQFSLPEISSLLFILGTLGYAIFHSLEKNSLIPLQDPRLPESIGFKNH